MTLALHIQTNREPIMNFSAPRPPDFQSRSPFKGVRGPTVYGESLLRKIYHASVASALNSLSMDNPDSLRLKFTSQSGQIIQIDPLDHASIEAVRLQAPGEGIRSAVSRHLVDLISKGLLTDPDMVPDDYRHLRPMIGWSQRLHAVLNAS